MTRRLFVFTLTVLITCGMVSLAAAADPSLGRTPKDTASPQTPAGAVKGEVLKIEGQYYLITEATTGKELRLHTDQDTKVIGAPKVGDRIVADITPDGHATGIKKDPGLTSPPKEPVSEQGK